ncbi:MAG: hypothetical protein JW971_08870 [Synergistales bacterium]|nr:hypothetical protein [Synergistales bacterium]
MRNKKTRIFILLAVLMSFFSSSAFAVEMSLTSDQLEYNPDQEKVFARGNVHFIREDLNVYASNCEGTVDGSQILFWDDLRGEGFLEGEKVSFKADFLEVSFKDSPYYALRGKVDAVVGSRLVKAEILELSGDVFNASAVERFTDKVSRISLSGQELHGRMEGADIEELDVRGEVRITLEEEDGNQTIVMGDRALYSRARGSLVVSGNARAIQRERKITAESLVIFPESSRIEAKGKPQIIFRLKEQN